MYLFCCREFTTNTESPQPSPTTIKGTTTNNIGDKTVLVASNMDVTCGESIFNKTYNKSGSSSSRVNFSIMEP